MAKKSRTYYTLLVRSMESGWRWSPEFGDWSRDVVKSEADDLHEGYKAIKRKDMKIITTGSEVTAINAAVAKLNGEV